MCFYSTFTPLFNSFIQINLIVDIINKYRIVDKIASVLNAFTSILILPVLNNSMIDESNKPKINTKLRIKV